MLVAHGRRRCEWEQEDATGYKWMRLKEVRKGSFHWKLSNRISPHEEDGDKSLRGDSTGARWQVGEAGMEG